MDNTRVDLTEYYRGNSLRKGLGRIKKYIVFFGYRCGYTIIPLTPEEPQIIRESPSYLHIPQDGITVSPSGCSPHEIMVTYRYGVHRAPRLTPFRWGPFFIKKMKKSEKRS